MFINILSTMKTKLFILTMATMLVACSQNQMDVPTSGQVVGVINCIDKGSESILCGCYIVTNTNDYILSFTNDIKLPYEFGVGVYGIPNYSIPFDFTYKVLDASDKEYIDFDMPVSDAMHMGLGYPCEQFKQAKLIRTNSNESK